MLTVWPSKWFNPDTAFTTCLTVAPEVWAAAEVPSVPLVQQVKSFVDFPV